MTGFRVPSRKCSLGPCTHPQSKCLLCAEPTVCQEVPLPSTPKLYKAHT